MVELLKSMLRILLPEKTLCYEHIFFFPHLPLPQRCQQSKKNHYKNFESYKKDGLKIYYII